MKTHHRPPTDTQGSVLGYASKTLQQPGRYDSSTRSVQAHSFHAWLRSLRCGHSKTDSRTGNSRMCHQCQPARLTGWCHSISTTRQPHQHPLQKTCQNHPTLCVPSAIQQQHHHSLKTNHALICTMVLFSVIQWPQACTTFMQALQHLQHRPAWQPQQTSLAQGALLPAKKEVQHYRQCSSAITQQTTGTACTAAALCKPTEHTGCHSLATATATLMILTLTTTRALHTGQCKHTGHTGCSTTMHSPARHSTGCCLPKHTIVQLCYVVTCVLLLPHCRCWCSNSEHMARLSSYREQGSGSPSTQRPPDRAPRNPVEQQKASARLASPQAAAAGQLHR